MFTISLRELNNAARVEITNRAQSVADDLSAQMDVMQGVAYDISIVPDYKVSYIEKHKYREVEMLSRLSVYQGYTPVSQQFFLLYEGNENIFIPSMKTTSRFSLFANTYLGCAQTEDAVALRRAIIDTQTASVIPTENHQMLFCYPIRYSNLADVDAHLCFIVGQETLAKRVALIGGDFHGALAVYWNDVLIYGEAGAQDTMSTSHGTNGISVRLHNVGSPVYNGLHNYTRFFWIAIIAIIVVTCIMAWVAAKRNYQPIQNLIDEFDETAVIGANELSSLHALLKRSIESGQISQQQLQENVQWLDQQRRKNYEQMMLLALTGHFHARPQQYSDQADPLEEDRSFLVLCISCHAKFSAEGLFRQIFELGDADTVMTAVRLPYESLIAVVVSSYVDIDSDATVSLLKDLMDADGLDASIGIGLITDNADHIPDSFAAALTDLGKESSISIAKANGWYDEVAIARLVAYIKNGQSDHAKSTLQAILAQIDTSNPSVLIRSCAYSSAINSIIQVAVQSGADISADKLSIILLYNQPV